MRVRDVRPHQRRSSHAERNYDRCACGCWKETTRYVCWRCDPEERPALHDHTHGDWVTVVYCPNDEFQRGVEFHAYQFGLTKGMETRSLTTTLEMGNWTPGMIVADREGRAWRVVGDGLQRLEAA